MSDLHWTGAAVLLALAVLGGESARPRRATILSWADFAREQNLDSGPQAASDERARLAATPVRGGRSHSAPTRLAS